MRYQHDLIANNLEMLERTHHKHNPDLSLDRHDVIGPEETFLVTDDTMADAM